VGTGCCSSANLFLRNHPGLEIHSDRRRDRVAGYLVHRTSNRLLEPETGGRAPGFFPARHSYKRPHRRRRAWFAACSFKPQSLCPHRYSGNVRGLQKTPYRPDAQAPRK
jgi:hypothetical protein